MSTATSSREHRVLAYGDSLTAGTSGMGLFPYAPHLEKGLQERGQKAIVRHRGLPGWTAANMLNELDDQNAGLRSAIRAVRDPPLSLVVILAGTNDMGFGSSVEAITKNLLRLHDVCYQEGVPRTIAIGVPPSGYQSVNVEAANMAKTINSNLQTFCAENADKATYHPFPFEYVQNGGNWFEDSLHFSQQGYQVLGKSLVPVVDKTLRSL